MKIPDSGVPTLRQAGSFRVHGCSGAQVQKGRNCPSSLGDPATALRLIVEERR